MRILDRYILSRFLYNFISSFLILMLIFIFQAIWFFIGELAGKDLDIVIIIKFLWYYSPNLVPNVLPLTVLLASIMTFGNLAENYEFAAMKSSGISLIRAMRSLIVFMLILGVCTFYFANDVIPKGEQKYYNLRRNIAKVKPATVIVEGVFSEMNGFNIKVDKKYGDKGQFFDNVIIHIKEKNEQNTTVIKAKHGELKSSENSNLLRLVLKDGNYYRDILPENSKDLYRYQNAKAHFEQYTILVDITKNLDLDTEGRDTYKMMNISELKHNIDSISEDNKRVLTSFGDNIYRRTGIENLEINQRRPVHNNKRKEEDSLKIEEKVKDTLTLDEVKNIVSLYKEGWRKEQLLDMALNNIHNMVQTIDNKRMDLNRRNKLLNVHIISMHEKYALAFACVILFFVGAPLGAIIRKGGLGLPMVVAILLFLTYHFLRIFMQNYAEDGSISPVLGAWFSTLVMLPLGVLFTRTATSDKALFSFSNFFAPVALFFKKYFKKLKSTKK
ncbi:LptF/LptG family permease [Zhouia sp. PK063]|uniref:LptF/LptG family permease n=1 Tax=Zhouia sp. PK063 TaxID=3373602 RepID=UPI0037878F66